MGHDGERGIRTHDGLFEVGVLNSKERIIESKYQTIWSLVRMQHQSDSSTQFHTPRTLAEAIRATSQH